jgi:hypothetical protein
LLTLLLGTGLYTATLDYGGTDTPVQGSVAAVHPAGGQPSSALPTERDAVAAGRYVFEHSGADDVVATNMYCRYPRRLRLAHKIECDTRNFVASALTQRRTLVGGWGYADRIVSAAWTSHVGYRNAPFWDPALLREQFRAVTHPTKNVLDTLYRDNHVRWIFVDLRDKPVAVDALSRLAILRRHGPTTAVWQLRPPP